VAEANGIELYSVFAGIISSQENAELYRKSSLKFTQGKEVLLAGSRPGKCPERVYIHGFPCGSCRADHLKNMR